MTIGYKTKKLVWERDCRQCFYCGKSLLWNEKTMDHVIPRSKGGPHRAWNIVLSCRPCNANKGDNDPTPEQLHTVLRWKMAHEMKISVGKSIAIAKNLGASEEVSELLCLMNKLTDAILARNPNNVSIPQNYTLRLVA